MYFVYILFCQDSSYYVGLTSNIKRRLGEHNNGLVHHTKSRLPIKLKWFCVFSDRHKAAAFEKYLKAGSGNAFFKKRLV
jgi:putative endonuclease